MYKRHAPPLSFLILLCITYTASQALDSTSSYSKIYDVSGKLFSSIHSRSKSLQNQLSKRTEKYLVCLAKQEKKLKRRLWKNDSLTANMLFGDVDARYAELKSELSERTSTSTAHGYYSGKIDSLKTALNFLNE